MKHLRALGLLLGCTTSFFAACSPGGAAPTPEGGEPTPTHGDAGVDVDAEPTDPTAPPNAPPGAAPSLQVTDLLPPGGECRYGGRATRLGRDRDGDGQLAANETERREVHCDLGYAERTIAVAPGPDCLGGGVRVQRGPDGNANGALEDGEVTTTEVVCGRVVQGDLVLETASDVEAAADVAAVTGNVEVRGSQPLVVRLPALRVVEKGVRLGSSALVELDAPVLARVGGALTAASAHALERLTLPTLASADYVSLSDVPRLPAVSLPALTELAGGLSVVDADALETLSLPLLETTGQITLSGFPRKVTYTWPRLRGISSGMFLNGLTSSFELGVTSLGLLHVTNGSALALSFPQLLGIEADLVLRNETLRTFSAPNLKRIGHELSMESVSELEAFTLPKLERLARLVVTGNAALNLFELPALGGDVEVVRIANNRRLGDLRGITGITGAAYLAVEGSESVFSDLGALSVEQARYVSVALPMRTVRLPKLRSVGELRVGANTNPNEVTLAVELPELEAAEQLRLSDLKVAERLVAPKLRSVSSTLLVTRSPKIPTCDTTRLLDALTTKPSTVTVLGTDPSAPCSSPLPP